MINYLQYKLIIVLYKTKNKKKDYFCYSNVWDYYQ